MKHLSIPTIILLLSAAILPAQNSGRRILLEEFSTAPCGFCPDGDIIAEQLVKDHPEVIWITHHAGFGTDSLTVSESVTIANAFTTFAPGACIDRGNYPIPVYTMPPFIAVSRQKWDSVCTAHLGDPRAANISIDNAFDAGSRTLACTVGVTFLSAPAAGDIRVNLYLIEDSARGIGKGFDQTNYFNGTPGHPCYQRGDPIVGYSHRRIVRAIPSGAWGAASVIPAAPEIGKLYSRSFTIPIPFRWNVNALETVAFASYFHTDAAKRPVIGSESKRVAGTSSEVGDPGNGPIPSVLSLYPNPARGEVRLTLPARRCGSAVAQILDRLGRTIAEYQIGEESTGLTLPTERLQTGLYFIRLLAGRSILGMGKFAVVQ